MKITLKASKYVNDTERKQLSKLHLKLGMMWPKFLINYHRKDNFVVLAKEREKVLGWLFGILTETSFPVNWIHKNQCHYHIYVGNKYRKKGIGRKLFIKATKHLSKIKCDRYLIYENDRNSAFFEKIGATNDNYRQNHFSRKIKKI